MQTPPRRSPGRPFAANRDAVERAALTLMLREGYEQVSVDDIAREAGIGRTTFFRYFKSKPGVVWSAFDDTISWLAENLTEKQEHPGVLDAIRESIVFSTRSAIYNSDVWLERFRLLDSSAELRADAYDHWERWASTIATFVATRTGLSPRDAIPMAIAGAARGMFLSELRNWLNTDDDREDILNRLDHNLKTVFAALSGLSAEL